MASYPAFHHYAQSDLENALAHCRKRTEAYEHSSYFWLGATAASLVGGASLLYTGLKRSSVPLALAGAGAGIALSYLTGKLASEERELASHWRSGLKSLEDRSASPCR